MKSHDIHTSINAKSHVCAGSNIYSLSPYRLHLFKKMKRNKAIMKQTKVSEWASDYNDFEWRCGYREDKWRKEKIENQKQLGIFEN